MTDFNNVKNYATYLKKLSPNEITILGSIIGILLCQNLGAYEAQAMGNLFELIGQSLLTYSSQLQLLNDDDD